MYKNEIVQIITIFTDTNLALVEDKSSNIIEISVDQLEKIN
jgi:oligoribonuclease (3'-5' exoribonuclease)